MCKTNMSLGTILILTISLSCANLDKNNIHFEAKIDEHINPYLDSRNFSGNIFIARQGKILFNKGYGMANFKLSIPNTPETKFQIASLSKTFTVAAVLLLKEQNQINLDDPISHFVPDYPNGDKITIHQLLNHTSGLPRYIFFPDYTKKSLQPHSAGEIVEWIKDKPLASNPGERTGYSNSNYVMLAYIVELVSGMDYDEFLRTNILDPLNLTNTGQRSDSKDLIKNLAVGYIPIGLNELEQSKYYDYSITIGAGSMYSTAEDLYNWYQALIKEKLINQSSLDLMMNQNAEDTSYGWIHDTWFNRNVFRKSGWDGVGFSTQFVHFIEEDLTIIVMLNLNISNIANEIVRNLSAIVLGEDFQPFIIISKPAIDKNKIKQIIGLYRFGDDFYVPNSSIEIIESNGYFYIKGNSPGQSAGLLKISDNEYIHRRYWFKVRFKWSDNGRIVGIKYGSFNAVKEPDG